MPTNFVINNRTLHRDASRSLVSALLEGITIDAPENAADLSNSPTPPTLKSRDISTPINSSESQEKPYDPSMLFLLEVATSLAIRNEESMRDLSAEVSEYCNEILRQRKHLHRILVERTLIYLMAIHKRGHETVIIHITCANPRVL